MLNKPPSFLGIDPSATRHSFNYASFNEECKLIALAGGEIEEVLALVTDERPAIVAVNAPPRPNQSLVRNELEKRQMSIGHLRGSNLRRAESELHEHGITLAPTPSKWEACPGWMQMGFDLFHSLEEVGYKQFPLEDAPFQWLETNPDAAFTALLGHLPFPKPSLEGRLQRQTALFEQGAGIKDPMDFFEEITRKKILHGELPFNLIYSSEELDTLMAAFIAYWAMEYPKELLLVGDSLEGQIALPVTSLKDVYR